MENNQQALKAGAVSTAEVTVLGVAGAAPVMCIGGSLHTLLGLTGYGVALSVLIATVIMVLVGLSYGDLAKKYNCAGGSYSYIARIFGVKAGLWSAFVYYGVTFTTSACPPTIFATYLTSLTGIPGYLGWAIFALVCFFVTWLGVGLSTKMTVFVFIVEMVLMLIPAFAIIGMSPEEFTFAAAVTNGFTATNGFNGLFLAVLVWVWAFVGVEVPAFMGEEMKSGGKGVKIAIPLAAAITGILYVICCCIWTSTLTPDQMGVLAGSTDALAAYCALYSYAGGETMVCISVMVAALACGLAFYTLMPRFMYDQARVGLLPKKVTKLNKNQVPHIATLIYLCFSFIFTMYGLYGYSESGLFNGINDHFTVMGINATTVYAFVCIANIKERWHDKGAGGFFFGKLFPLIAAAIILYIIFFTSPVKYIVLTLGWYAVALILAILLAKRVKLADLAE